MKVIGLLGNQGVGKNYIAKYLQTSISHKDD